MKKILFLVLVLTSKPLMAEEIYLTVGESHSVNLKPEQSVRVKGKETIIVRPKAHQLEIVGKAKGTATLKLGDSDYSIFVVDKKNLEFLKALHLKFSEMLGLRAEMRAGLPAVTGQLHRLEDWQAIAKTAEEYDCAYNMHAKIDEDVIGQAKIWIKQKLLSNNLPLPLLIWSSQPHAILSVDHQNLASHLEQLFHRLGIAIKYEKSQLAIEPLVRVRIVVAEVNKKLQSQFGIEWPNMISAQLSPRFKGPTSLDIFLKAMEQNGLGQILASPNLLARSGGEADFLAGGEFAIKVISRQMRDVIWKKHGIYLKIKPKADRTGRLSIELSTEVSLLDQSQSVDGIPGLKTNRMATQFDLQTSQTIVLSGLIRNDWGQSENGIMGLSKIPILGSLFSSKEFTSSRSELIIFVTPEIVTEQVESESQLLPKGWVQNG